MSDVYEYPIEAIEAHNKAWAEAQAEIVKLRAEIERLKRERDDAKEALRMLAEAAAGKVPT